jgi:hypothetical protein
MAKIPNQIGYQGHHSPEKNCTCEVMGVKQNQTGGEICAIRIAHDNQTSSVEIVSLGGSVDKLCQFFRPGPDVLNASLGEPSK